jgi:hypothetical protein
MVMFSFDLNAKIAELRATLEPQSSTARAIDGKQPRSLIIQCARNEGHFAFADELERMMRLRKSPPEIAPAPIEAATPKAPTPHRKPIAQHPIGALMPNGSTSRA